MLFGSILKNAGQYLFFLLVLPLVIQAGEALLSVKTNPPGAQVWLAPVSTGQRQLLGETPILKAPVEAGRYDITLALEDYDTLYIDAIELPEGNHIKIGKPLSSRYAKLRILTEPDSAKVFLDELLVGTSPYENNLVHPGTYAIKVIPPSPLYRVSKQSLTLRQGDTLTVKQNLIYRNKAFDRMHLSNPPYRIQFETGFERLSKYGEFDSTGKAKRLPLDKVTSIWNIPMQLSLGLPSGFEIHAGIPLSASRINQGGKRDWSTSGLEFGGKYTYTPYSLGMDVTYSTRVGDVSPSSLRFTAIGFAAKDKIQAFANLGYSFNFPFPSEPDVDPGDQLKITARGGYLFDPWLPYLAADLNGVMPENEDGKNQGAFTYDITAELGIIMDAAETFSWQFGIPFTVLGNGGPDSRPVYRFWGFHLSLLIGISLK